MPSDAGFDKGAHLAFGDIKVDNPRNPQSLQIRIKASKTDPFRQGVAIYVGRTNMPLCPVASYMMQRGNKPDPAFSCFRMVDPLPEPDS